MSIFYSKSVRFQIVGSILISEQSVLRVIKTYNLIKFGLYQKNCVRVESGSEVAQRQQAFDMLKDDELMIFYLYLLHHNAFLSETCFTGKQTFKDSKQTQI